MTPIVPLEVEVARSDDFRAPARGPDRGPPPAISSRSASAPAASEPEASTLPEGGGGEASGAEERVGAATATEEVQIAALPPSRDAAGNLSIPFGLGEARIPDDAYPELRTVARSLLSNSDLRVQVLAFATGDDEADTSARRTSLSRALAVRSYLIDAGIRSTRIDVRALGDSSDRGPVDRVEVVLSQS